MEYGDSMGKVKVIVVNGLSCSGKDSFIAAVTKKAPVVVSFSSIGTVRGALIGAGILDHKKKTEKERAFLVAVKQAWIEYSDGPYREVLKVVDNLEKACEFMNNIDRVLLFVQVREPKEIYKLYTHFMENFFSVLVERSEAILQPGDEGVLNFDYDFDVHNNGSLEDLETDLGKEADRFIQFLDEETE